MPSRCLQLLVHDPALVSRTMVEDVLRFKRLDGVTAALETIARAWFPGGRQTLDLAAAIAGLALPVQVIWGRDDRIIPVAHAEALASAGAGACAGGGRPSAAHGEVRRGEPADPPVHRRMTHDR